MKIKGVAISSTQISVLVIVWLAFLLSFVDRLSWPPVMPLVSKELGMTAKQAGSYMTAFYIGYVATQLPGGLLTDRFGYRKVLLGSFALMGVFTALMGTITTYEQGFTYRILAGIGSGAVFSASVRAIFDWFPGQIRGTAMGIFMTSSSLGLAAVNLFVPTLAKTHGWQYSFVAAGLLPILALLFAWPLLKQKPRETVSEGQPVGQFFKDIFGLFTNKNLMLTGLAGFCAMWATWGTATWANTYMAKSLNLTLVQAGLFMSLYGTASLACKPIAGLLSDLLRGKRNILLAVMLGTFFVCLLLFGANTSVSMLYILAPMLGVAAFMYSPVMNTLISEVVQPKLVGTATGFVNTIWQLGSLISPLAVGAVLDATNNYFYAFATLAAGPLIGAFIIFLIHDNSAEGIA